MHVRSGTITPMSLPQMNAKNFTRTRKQNRHLLAATSALSLLFISCSDSTQVSAPDLNPPPEIPGATAFSGNAMPPSIATIERVMDERAPVISSTPPPPIMGGSLRVLESGSTAVAADPARDVVAFVDLESGTVVQRLELPAGAQPGRIAESPGMVHVVLAGSGQVLSLDARGNRVWEASVCPEPQGLDYLPSTDRLLLACRDGRVLSLSAEEGQSALFASLPTDLRDVLVVPSSVDSNSTQPTIYVSRFHSAELFVLHADGTVAPTVTLPDITMMRFEMEATNDVTPNSKPTSGGIVATDFAANVAWRARTVNGEVAVLHQRAQRGEIPVSSDGGYGSGGCERVVQPGVSKLGQGSSVLTSIGMSMVNVAVDFAVSPDGIWWAVADAGVADPGVPRDFVIRSDGGDPTTVGFSETPPEQPLSDDPESTLPWAQQNAPVQLFLATDLNLTTPEMTADDFCGPSPRTSLVGKSGVQAIAVEFNPTRPAQLVVLLRQPAELLIQDDVSTGTAVRSVALGGADITDTGHDLFHRVDTAVACVHCHPGGAEDSHVWNFEGFGDRRTQSLETGLRAPFHWDGDLTDMDHLMTEIFQGRMSAAPQSAPRVAALEDWLRSLTPPAAGVITQPELVEQGRLLFTSAPIGCASCHSGVALTDGKLHDVGTSAGVPLKTPSLVGVSQRLPVMHDGCARTLRDRFGGTCGGGDQHGVTSHLTAADFDALTAYLESL